MIIKGNEINVIWIFNFRDSFLYYIWKPIELNGHINDNGVTSYMVASNPEILSQLLKENEARGVEYNPALYTTPTNAFNTSKVDFAPTGHPPPTPYTGRTRTSQPSQCSMPGSLENPIWSTILARINPLHFIPWRLPRFFLVNSKKNVFGNLSQTQPIFAASSDFIVC